MKEYVYKVGLVLTLLSVFFLVLDCGPLCELDRTKDIVSPCHQDPSSASQEERSCDWDAGSLNFAESDSGYSKFQVVLLTIDFIFGTSDRFATLFPSRRTNHSRLSLYTFEYPNILSSIRLLI
ncbi:hypothetical protein [Leptospira ellisii]|nr:hypothetical protein [Leptospira ellisii]PJZ94326.1 hypothetical protein CH379_03210 [Leptospira ellisii]PKA05705.1 hypothetical protein CH375_03685 [Leptospira ellisii]